MFRRIRNLWFLSNVDFSKKEKKTYIHPLLTPDGIKERMGVKKMAKIIEDDREELFKEEKPEIK